MRKLVSNNVVQRFKQGRKIQKFQGAGQINYNSGYGSSYGDQFRAKARRYNAQIKRDKSSNRYYFDTPTGRYYSDAGEFRKEYNNLQRLNRSTKQVTGLGQAIIDTYKKQSKSTTESTTKPATVKPSGTNKSTTVKPTTVNRPTTARPTAVNRPKYTAPAGIDVTQTQQMLLKNGFYDQDYVKRTSNVTDGIWGKQTQAAWDAYQKKLQDGSISVESTDKENVVNGPGYKPQSTGTEMVTLSDEITSQPDVTNKRIRGFHGMFRNSDDYWDWIQGNQNTKLAQLWNPVYSGFQDQDKKKEVFNAIMNQYGLSGRNFRRNLDQFTNLTNYLRKLGTEGSEERNQFIDDYNKAYNQERANQEQANQASQFRMRMMYPNAFNNNLEQIFKVPKTFSLKYQSGGLISRNPVQRFKNGGIPKLQSAWQTLGEEQRRKNDDFVNRTMSITQNIIDNSKRKEEANARANKRNRAPMRTDNIALLQDALWKVGAFKGVKDKRGNEANYKSAVDGISGRMTKTAIANAQKMGYNVNTEAGTVSMKRHVRVPKLQKQQNVSGEPKVDNSRNTIEEEPKTSTRNYEIPEEDRVDFAKWLYNLGVQSHYGSNVFDTGSAYLKSLTGLGRTLNPSVGTAQQAIALHLIDRDDIHKRGDNIYHKLGYIPGTNKYKWAYLNGGKETHNKDQNLLQKAARSGQFVLGRFDLTETPTEYVINDDYNFNESGTDYSKQKIDSGEATLYDKLRYLGGQGANETMPVNLTVSKDDVLNWYNLYKRKNSNNMNTEPRIVGFRSII